MLERKLAEKFRKLYTENSLKLKNYEDQLFTLQDPFDWIQLLSERSYVMRDVFEENEELMAELWENCSDEITPEEAELLYDLAIGFFFDGHHDFVVLTEFCERILPVFIDIDEPEFLVAIYHVLGSEYARFYHSLGDAKGMNTAIEYFRKSIGEVSRYSQISSPEIREFIFQDYSYLIIYLSNFHTEKNESIRLYDDAWTLWDNENVQELDKDNENIKRYLSIAEDAFVAKCKNIEILSEEDRDKYLELIGETSKRAENNGGDIEGSPAFRTCITNKWLRKEISSEEIFEKIVKSINELIPTPDFTKDDPVNYELVMRYFKYACTAIMVLEKMQLKGRKLEEYTEMFMPKAMSVLSNIPYKFFTGEMQPICEQWYHAVEPVLTSELDKVQFIMQMIVRRQPFTYIHSQMVAKIATLIGHEIISKDPEALVGVRGILSAEDVQKNKAYLLSFITISGLVHDIGKCYIPDTINRQNRSLNTKEFATIRKHTEVGYREAQKNAAIVPYGDVILGHHKHYDGLHGYPLSYDNTKSPIRIIIDLISIADSIEAGTDILTRSYTKGKDCKRLLKELQAEAGTRYNPRIVKVIESSPKLIEELENVTGQGRYDLYYKAMQEILGKAKEEIPDIKI
ncbi:HD-GYP domain-containing protein [Butyrivibrio sp. AE3004]|uniref:HD-GYP domain-containing protein n=1 Tax=Butyrivibrio sp. AE3004 TaxID=1506994 RepID=UPI000494C919|nr:HD domain-containing protein [Butyrivibrio sp. AE3004]